MIKKIFPVLALAVGLASGGTAAMLLSPTTDEAEDLSSDAMLTAPASQELEAASIKDVPVSLEIVKLPSQFVVPVIMDARVRAMVILTVALEVETGNGDRVRALEPKLRDEFLDELFGLASNDGFKDDLITRDTLEILKRVLTERSKEVLGVSTVTVLITDIARQDVF